MWDILYITVAALMGIGALVYPIRRWYPLFNALWLMFLVLLGTALFGIYHQYTDASCLTINALSFIILMGYLLFIPPK